MLDLLELFYAECSFICLQIPSFQAPVVGDTVFSLMCIFGVLKIKEKKSGSHSCVVLDLESCVLFHCLFLYWCCAVFMTLAVWRNWKSGMVTAPAVFILLRIAVTL